MAEFEDLWGEEFTLPKEKEKTRKIVKKATEPKEKSISTTSQETIAKAAKSKKLSKAELLEIIKEKVLSVLGKQKYNLELIKTREQFHDYVSKCIEAGRIAIDTETNNSLDPITCKLMGLCLYAPGLKQAYVPINHWDYTTQERLSWQLTEKDVAEEMQRVIDAKIPIIMHNGKFDYQVIKCTCGIEIIPTWDTMIGAKLLDENEKSAGLKQQYIDKIDPEQEKYDIENLFKNVEYADVDPDLFMYYAATDALMTDKLYEWQMNKFKDPDLARVLNLAETVEMPLVQVVAEMELNGVEFDKEYDERLSKKYHRKLDDLDKKVEAELLKLKPLIDEWRLTPEANAKTKKKSGEGEGKSKAEQLTDPINVASPTQLAILFYDVLKHPVVDKKSPRGTGEDILEKIEFPIAKLLLERRGLMKLITAFIDSLPEWVNPKTGRIHCHFNAYGAATGRFSSSEPNLQQIPSGNHEIRLIFKASDPEQLVEENSDQVFEVSSISDVLTPDGWKPVKMLTAGEKIVLEDNSIVKIESICQMEKFYSIKYQ